DLCGASRQSSSLQLGASPRGATALLRTSRAWAWLSGRDYVTPDDVKALAKGTLRHRVALRPEAELEGATSDGVLDGVLASVSVLRSPEPATGPTGFGGSTDGDHGTHGPGGVRRDARGAGGRLPGRLDGLGGDRRAGAARRGGPGAGAERPPGLLRAVRRDRHPAGRVRRGGAGGGQPVRPEAARRAAGRLGAELRRPPGAAPAVGPGRGAPPAEHRAHPGAPRRPPRGRGDGAL